MKRLFLIVFALVAFQTNAQDRKPDFKKGERHAHIERFKDFSPEEIATLQTKKMTLALDLTEAQQKKVEKLLLEKTTERKAKMEERQERMKDSNEKPSKGERYVMMNERLDNQIEMKQKLSQILDKEQMEKWEEIQMKRKQFKHKKPRESRKGRS